MSARERVARGAAYLDTIRPGWAAEVDPSMLDMADGCRCILGQLFEAERDGTYVTPYYTAWEKLGLDRRVPAHPEWMLDEWYGFDVPREGDANTAYQKLREAWQREIAARTGAPA